MKQQPDHQSLNIIAYQPALRPALPTVYGSLDYHEQRALFERMDRILAQSGLDQDFLAAACADQQLDLNSRTDKQNARFARFSAVCLRAKVARSLLGLAHREFCARLADSPLLQWFLHVGQVDAVRVFTKRIKQHAAAHLEALQTRRSESELSIGQARVIEQRIERVLEQLPTAIKQAHERIIGGRQVKNADKILSLYDDQVQVIVRGKANAEVEFGNKFTLVENSQGLIIDYQLHEGNPADSNLVEPCLDRLQASALPVSKLWADRGMFSKRNEELLAARGIQSGLCPRDARELAQRLQDPEVKTGMKRRGGTEARVAIFKNVFLGNPAQGRSFGARERACGWAVFTHNLWVLARLGQVAAKTKPKRCPAPRRPSEAARRAA